MAGDWMKEFKERFGDTAKPVPTSRLERIWKTGRTAAGMAAVLLGRGESIDFAAIGKAVLRLGGLLVRAGGASRSLRRTGRLALQAGGRSSTAELAHALPALWGVDGRKPALQRRQPEQSVLHRVVREGWPLVLAAAEDRGGFPKRVHEIEGTHDSDLLGSGPGQRRDRNHAIGGWAA